MNPIPIFTYQVINEQIVAPDDQLISHKGTLIIPKCWEQRKQWRAWLALQTLQHTDSSTLNDAKLVWSM